MRDGEVKKMTPAPSFATDMIVTDMPELLMRAY